MPADVSVFMLTLLSQGAELVSWHANLQIKAAVSLVVYKICEDPTANYSNMTTQYTRYMAAAGASGLGGMLGGLRGGLAGYGAAAGSPVNLSQQTQKI